MPIQKSNLSNGVRILSESVGHVGSVSIGLWCRTGSAHETPPEAGITHFIEHMLFKGTARRSALQIAEEIEGRGGILNAFTDKEQTCYYCRVLADDVETAVDVLADMVTASSLDPDELAKEQGVVLEEIKRIEDEPGDHVHDLHLQGLWPDNVLGQRIIGTPESVASFDRDDLTAYMGRRYRAENLLLAAAGNVDHDRLVGYASERLAPVEPGNGTPALPRPVSVPGEHQVAKDVEQVHFCIGTSGVGVYDPELYTATVMDAVLGGGMSSRLFQEVREKRGLAYSVGSYSLVYSSGGAFTVYGGTSLKTWEETQQVVRAELDKLMADGVPDAELAKVKRQISGNMVLALEGMSSRMMRMARNEFNHGRDIPVEETLSKIERVSSTEIVELARRTLGADSVRTTAIGPF